MPVRSLRCARPLGALLLAAAAACSERSAPTEAPALTPSAGPSASAAAATAGVTFRLYTPQSSGLFEVIAGSGAGGRFIRRDLGECATIVAPGAHCPTHLRVVGYTDRVSRRDTVHTSARGAGIADDLGVTVNGRVRGAWLWVPLPAFVPATVSVNANDDNIAVFATQYGVRYTKRVPVGMR